MAKIQFGDIVTDMRGKSGGHVYARNRYGAFKRTKVTPTNPQTSYQMQQRQYFGSNSQSWRGLDEDQRAAWIALAPSLPVQDVFGNSRVLTGQALFIRLNTNLALTNSDLIQDAPTPVALPTISGLTLSITAEGAYNVTVGTIGDTSDVKALLFATPPVSPGVSSVKNKYRLLTIFTTFNSTVDVASVYNLRFVALTEGEKVFFRAYLVNTVTGQSGTAVSNVAIVGPAE